MFFIIFLLNYLNFLRILKINNLDKNKIIDVKYGDVKCYRAKVVKIDNDTKKILVHYSGWNNR